MSFMDDLFILANNALQKQGSNIVEAATLVSKATSLPELLRARKEALRWSTAVSNAFTDGMTKEQADLIARESRNEGPADALRHCYLAAMLGRDLGYNDALQVMTAHEMNASWGTPASRMDLHNNAVGIEIGVRMKGGTDVDLSSATMEAFLQGRLRVLDKRNGNKLVPTKSLTFGR